MADEVFTGDIELVSIAQAKDWLRLRAKKGARCPCCKQYVKIYKRPLGAPMARWLIWLVRTWKYADKARYGSTPRFSFDRRFEEGTPNGVWIDVRKSPVRGGDYAKLSHWGLVEEKPHVPGTKKDNGAVDTKDSGMWRPTFKGIDFVYKRIEVPSHVILYDNIKLGETKTLITIVQALGKKHSYQELMNSAVKVEVPV
jgi:hypothetical protein